MKRQNAKAQKLGLRKLTKNSTSVVNNDIENKTIRHGHGYGMNKWMDILSEDAVAPETGLYAFACRGDNYVLHKFYFMQKRERLFKYFEGQ